VANLQKSIKDYIAKDYAGYSIKNAFKMDHNKVITYDVNLVKGKQNVCLAFDNNGSFLKVVEPKNKTNALNKTTAMNSKHHSATTK
jgi:hemerythrin superfamily protein